MNYYQVIYTLNNETKFINRYTTFIFSDTDYRMELSCCNHRKDISFATEDVLVALSLRH